MQQPVIGMKARYELVVTEDLTAASMGSGLLPVFATPCMIAMMEGAATKCVQACLEEGWSTVGTMINIKHMAPTPLGSKVYAEAELIENDGRRWMFSVRAYDESGLIGDGVHERYSIENKRFLEKCAGRKAPV